MTAWDDDPALQLSAVPTVAGMMLTSKFRAGFAQLQRFGLSFDTWVYPSQAADVAALARTFPDTVFIVNHTATPIGIGRRAQDRASALQEWRSAIRLLANCPNVMMKLGGLGTPFTGIDWSQIGGATPSESLANALRGYIDFAIESFSPQRSLFESNFPVDRLSYSYRSIWNAFKRLTIRYSRAERAALFHDNAARIYQLNSRPTLRFAA